MRQQYNRLTRLRRGRANRAYDGLDRIDAHAAKRATLNWRVALRAKPPVASSADASMAAREQVHIDDMLVADDAFALVEVV